MSLFDPTSSCDDVTYVIDDVPCTVKLPVIIVEPEIVWLPMNVFDPVVAIAPIPVVFCTTTCDDCDTIPANNIVPVAVIFCAFIVPVNVGLALITTLPVPVIALLTNPSLAFVKTAWFAVNADAVILVALMVVGAIVCAATPATTCAELDTVPPGSNGAI